MWMLWKMRFWNCEFCQKCDFEIVNFVKKCDFENVNFVKNATFKMWFLWKMRFSKCEFLDKLCDFCLIVWYLANFTSEAMSSIWAMEISWLGSVYSSLHSRVSNVNSLLNWMAGGSQSQGSAPVNRPKFK